jgi:hypothetical protein
MGCLTRDGIDHCKEEEAPSAPTGIEPDAGIVDIPFDTEIRPCKFSCKKYFEASSTPS